MNRCETATWGTLWPPVPPLGAPLGGLVGQGLRPSSKLSHVGFPGEQEEALGLAPSSHTAQLHRGRGGHQADKTERHWSFQMWGAQRPQPGIGTLRTGTGAQAPPGTTQMGTNTQAVPSFPEPEPSSGKREVPQHALLACHLPR